MSRIFWDTNVYIYLFENHPTFHPEVVRLRQKMLSRGDELLTSWLTVGEVQVQASPARNRPVKTVYKGAIIAASQLLPFAEEAAESYREVRNLTNVRGPDAVQLACAAAAGVELFVTNDKKLHGLQIPGIHFIASIASAEALL